jgi:long-chain fatty acid transport protein
MKKLLYLVLFSALTMNICLAGGFELYEFGARSASMGGAVVARAFDASTIFYNPSGLAFVPGTNFYGGVTLITSTVKYSGAEPIFTGDEYTSVDQLHTPIGIYFSHQFNDDLFAGIGVTNPFGLGLKWDQDFPGAGIAYNTDLKSYYVSPVVAYKVSDEFSIGGGLDIVFGSVTLERFVYLFGSETSPGTAVATSKIEGSSKPALGFTASLTYRGERLGAGFLYRHSVKNKLDDGTIAFNFIDSPIEGFARNVLKDQGVSTSITFPSFISVGVYYKLLDNLGAEFDYMWYDWSVFDKLDFSFDDPTLNQTVNEDYENSGQFRIGLHYNLTKELEFRLGYIYDQTPQPVHSMSPLLPDNDRNDFSFGAGYTYNNWQFDIGYMLVDFGDRSTVENGVGKNENGFDGTYATIANLFMFSFGVSL